MNKERLKQRKLGNFKVIISIIFTYSIPILIIIFDDSLGMLAFIIFIFGSIISIIYGLRVKELNIEYYGYLKSLRRGEIRFNHNYNQNQNFNSEISLEIKLNELEKLYEKGKISQTEYEFKRKQIIEKY